MDANGKRADEANATIDRLTDQLAKVSTWQDEVSLQSLEPAEAEAFRNNRLQQRIEDLEVERVEEKRVAKEQQDFEAQRTVEWTRALALGVTSDQIDHTSAETIKASIQKWEEKAGGRKLEELASSVSKLQQDLIEARSAAGRLSRSEAGDTTVVGDVSSGAVGVGLSSGDTLDEQLETVPPEAQALIREGESLIGKKGKGGRIIMIQNQLATQYNLDVGFKS